MNNKYINTKIILLSIIITLSLSACKNESESENLSASDSTTANLSSKDDSLTSAASELESSYPTNQIDINIDIDNESSEIVSEVVSTSTIQTTTTALSTTKPAQILTKITTTVITTKPVTTRKSETTTMPVAVSFKKVLEAEDGKMSGSVSSTTSRSGYSGSSYVSGFNQKSGNAWSIIVDIPTSQHYKVTVRTASDSPKENFLLADGVQVMTINSVGNGKFTDMTVDGIYLKKGAITLSIKESWGWFDLDSISIETGEGTSDSIYSSVTTSLVNKNSNTKTKNIMQYFIDNYGKKVISGQYTNHNSSTEVEAIYKETGKYPALRGFDFIFYSPNSGYWGNDTDLAIDWSAKGGLVTFSWHWHGPKGAHEFYTEKTDFDLSKAVTSIDLSTKSLADVKLLYESGKITEQAYLIVRDIDAISEQLKILQNNNVTVLWRPLHEASGGWFWWGAKGADSYKWLWKLMYNRQTNYHKLNNLIWVWNGQSKSWYPGDSYCDIVGTDIYADNHTYTAQTDKFIDTVGFANGKRMVALTENGVMIDPDLIERDNTYWLWFNVWCREFIVTGTSVTGIYTEKSMMIGLHYKCNTKQKAMTHFET